VRPPEKGKEGGEKEKEGGREGEGRGWSPRMPKSRVGKPNTNMFA